MVSSIVRWALSVVLAFTVVLVLPGAAVASFGDPVTLGTGTTSEPQVVIDSAGRATVVWQRTDGFEHWIEARTIAADGTLGKIKELITTIQYAADPQVGVDANGKSTVVWQRFDGANNRIQARTMAANGTLGSTQTLVNTPQNASDPQVGVDADGQATVVWSGNDGTTNRIQARTIAANGTLGTTQTLSTAGQNAADPQVGVDADGQATVVWSGDDGSSTRIQARTIAADGTLGTTRKLSAAGQNASDPQVGVDADGQATVVWSGNDGTNTRIQARTIAANGTLGTTDTLSTAGKDAYAPQVAIDSNGVATVVWYRAAIEYARSTS